MNYDLVVQSPPCFSLFDELYHVYMYMYMYLYTHAHTYAYTCICMHMYPLDARPQVFVSFFCFVIFICLLVCMARSVAVVRVIWLLARVHAIHVLCFSLSELSSSAVT
jgi:hypothetical protein